MMRVSARHRAGILDSAGVSDEEIELVRDVLRRMIAAFREVGE
jgi:hypothetical protein